MCLLFGRLAAMNGEIVIMGSSVPRLPEIMNVATLDSAACSSNLQALPHPRITLQNS